MAQLVRTLTGQSTKAFNEPAPPILARMTTTDAQTGILNHLSESQEQKLEEFKSRLEQEGWWSPDGINGKPTHDDGTLLRYLRARKFDVQGAYGQFTDTEKWMKEQRVEELYEHFDVDMFEKTRRMYPAWTGHRDKRGIPIYVYEIQGLNTKAVSAYEKETAAYKATLPNHKDLSTPPKHLPLFALYHNLLNFVLPLCSALERPQPEIPVTNSTNIVDIKGVSLRQFWNLKAHMQDASVLATAHYPETLDRIFIIGAPAFFPTVWGWIKGWFDPVTVSKIFILSKQEVKVTLERFMDLKDIPEQYGGTLKWQWGDDPDLDKETREALETDGHKGWVHGPALWLEQRRVIVGSENGKLRRSDEEVAAMKPITYAADFTEEPVHRETRRLSVSSHRKLLAEKSSRSSQSSFKHTHTPPLAEEAAASVVPSAALAAPVAAPTTSTAAASSATEQLPAHSSSLQQQIPDHIPHEAVRSSPMGDSIIHLPTAQPAPPAQTAEYISPLAGAQTVQNQQSPTTNGTIPMPLPPQAVSQVQYVQDTPLQTSKAVPYHTSQAASGILGNPTAKTHLNIAQDLDEESTVILPADTSRPEMILASDRSKELAIETEKMNLVGATGTSPTRPAPERFMTAAEF